MKTRLALIALILIAGIGGFVWHSNQPEQKIGKVVDQFIGAVEYDSTKLRSRDEVHEAILGSTAETIRLKVSSDLPGGIKIPKEMTSERLCARLDLLHSMTSKREFDTIEEELDLIDKEAQLKRVINITMASPLQGQNVETWELVFDLELKDDWKITAIRAKRRN